MKKTDKSGKSTYGALVRKLYDHLFSRSFRKKRVELTSHLQSIADKFDGRIYYDAYSELFPKIEFTREGYDYHMIVTPGYTGLDAFRVGFVYAGQHSYFKKYPFPHLTIYSRTIMKDIFANPGLKSVFSTDEVFSSRFIASCPEVLSLDLVLDKSSMEAFFKLYYLFNRNDLYFTSQGSRAMVRKEADYKILSDEKAIGSFLDTADDFFQSLYNCHRMLVDEVDPASWIKYVGSSLESAKCRICGEQIYFSRVMCSDCDTPHHLDCWEYNGCCSVYGCGSKRYYFPSV